MRFAVSNIGWAPELDAAVAGELRAAGAAGVEIAPTAAWPDPAAVPAAERRAYGERWRARGLPVVALQSLLFGRPELQLLDPRTHRMLRERLLVMLDVARDLGARPLVLGSPRNRTRGALSAESALAIAVPFLREIGDEAAQRGVVLCVEPNPPAYGCDFVTTAAEGRALVEAVGSPGFRLHLDAAAMHLAGDDAPAEIARSAGVLEHVHLSSPGLGPVAPGSAVDHGAIVGRLREVGYAGLVSIEMRAGKDAAESLANVRVATRHVAALLREATER